MKSEKIKVCSQCNSEDVSSLNVDGSIIDVCNECGAQENIKHIDAIN